tara:strand:- start:5552 stop:5668 length:117 start_codon:yes stop_codon:yes gene_type:complete
MRASMLHHVGELGDLGSMFGQQFWIVFQKRDLDRAQDQ